MENADFAGRVALVTGAWRGLRRDAAARLHDRGASVAVNVRNRERAFDVPGDVAEDSVPDEIARRTVERFGRIDILVNNADALQKLDGTDASVGLNDVQRHHRLNFPSSVVWKMASPV